ncbi:nitrate reductase molybdenum cofactor assembly chaperone [Corynebacterium tapiri]|uniref:Nitrate reductase molybdenum cofactor assembly chaperone n=2 Tax=Corynebacterium tapiri TaxID=1448266 RepID=A0A5C4U642_9CORY|nr:nitrate reductase molybdenum cofactor assembly chaperone [Corynebacterium tapiri]
MAVAVLLAYPGEDFSARLQSVSEAATDVPAAIRENIEAFVASTAAWSNRDVQSHYVETFDQRRRCSLFLSYYSVGDTRQRGAAILTFRHQLQELGLQEISDELPDHLCVLLEALGNSEGERHERAVEMLAAHRDGIEVLRAALDNLSSPYSHLITAVCQFLPEIDEETAARYIDLITSGPPAEMVGITQLPFPSAQPDHA